MKTKLIAAIISPIIIVGCAQKPTIGRDMVLVPLHSAMLTNCENIGSIHLDVDTGAQTFWTGKAEAVKEIKFRMRDQAKAQYPNSDVVAIPDIDADNFTFSYNVMGIAYKCFK